MLPAPLALDRLLSWVGAAHLFVGVVAAASLAVDRPRVLGLHPAQKPMKFAFSIAAFLFTMAVLVPGLAVGEFTRRWLALFLALVMSMEMAVIGGQALRGRRSHFNRETPLDAAFTTVLLLGIAIFLLEMVAITLLAAIRPLAFSPLVQAAWRAALCIFLFGAVSGFGMGGRGGHAVGGDEKSPSFPVTNWSRTHGDLRVSHFFSLHALQIIPLAAFLISRISAADHARWFLLFLVVVGNALLAGATWLQALASRPFGFSVGKGR